jgi:low affinity Fe/Cu permease
MNVQPSPEGLGRLIIVIGLALVVVGVTVSFARTLRLGSLPGDIHWSGRGWQVWVPLGTSIVLSLLLTVILNVFLRRR